MTKITTTAIRKLKTVRPLVAVTAYDAVTARHADRAGVDLILVGDSLGNTVLGFDSTVPVTVDMMLHHTAAVARARPQALVVADIPFAEASFGIDSLVRCARRFLQEAGADAVKIEGGAVIADKVAALTGAGIPVLGHIGLLPQQVLQLGGYRRFGKSKAERTALVADAHALHQAGAFALVAEMVDPQGCRQLGTEVPIPVIGIGSGPHCDGQILVSADLLGLSDGRAPSFAKQYTNLGESMEAAFSAYAKDVREGRFPS